MSTVICAVCGDVMDIEDAWGPIIDEGEEEWFCPECAEMHGVCKDQFGIDEMEEE